MWTGWLWALNDGLYRASARGMLMGGQRGRERYSVIGWPEPSLNAAAERAGDDEDWEEGAGGG